MQVFGRERVERTFESLKKSGKVFEDEMADFCAQVGGCPW